MDFALFAFDSPRTLTFPAGIMGIALVLVYLGSAGTLFYARRHDWRGWPLTRWFGLFVALGVAFLASGLFLVSLPGPEILPLPNLPDIPDVPAAPILGAVTVILAGVWLGVGPAILVGGAAGLGHALATTGRGVQSMELALVAGLVAFLLCQEYRGKAFGWLRRPLPAGIAGGAAASFVAFPFLLTSAGPDTPFLSAVDFAWSHTRAALFPNLLEWGFAGLLVEGLFALSPELRRRPSRLVPPPYAYSLTRGFLYALVPWFLVTFVGLLAVVTHIATDSATDLTLKQMSHDARVASDAIPNLNLISTNLLVQFAKNEALLQGEPDQQQVVADQFFTWKGCCVRLRTFGSWSYLTGRARMCSGIPRIQSLYRKRRQDRHSGCCRGRA